MSINCIKNTSNINNKAKQINIPVMVSSAVGVMLPLMILRKHQGLALNKNELSNLKLSEKASKIWKSLNIDYGLKEILSVGVVSSLFGLGGGIISDKNKENRKEKVKECIFSVDNLVLPTFLTAGMLKIFSKSKNKIFPKIISPLFGVGLGMPVASKISNTIISKIDNNSKKRKLKPTDVAVHTDDIADVLLLTKSKIAEKLQIGRILGGIYFMNAYKIGSRTKKEDFS